jgi:hypothetical protein
VARIVVLWASALCGALGVAWAVAAPAGAALTLTLSAGSILQRVAGHARINHVRVYGFALVLFGFNALALNSLAFAAGALIRFGFDVLTPL